MVGPEVPRRQRPSGDDFFISPLREYLAG